MADTTSRSELLRSTLWPALWMFAIPLVALLFASFAINKWDGEYGASIAQAISADTKIEAGVRDALLQDWQAVALSDLCRARGMDRWFGLGEAVASPFPALPETVVVEWCGDYQHFFWIESGAIWSLAVGLAAVLLAAACTFAAFRSRQLEYRCFVFGWQALRFVCLFETIVQALLVGLLSFWVTAVLFQIYIVKLVAVFGVLAAIAAFTVLKAIFANPTQQMEVEGRLLAREQAPVLWQSIEGICQRLGTKPPQQIVAGIDNSFFVTESPVKVGSAMSEGRCLFVSLSLLRTLTRAEADAIMTHEMAHFSGGDTEHTKRMAPALIRFDHYLEALAKGGLSYPIHLFMFAYRSMFELAIGASSRLRELRADKLAAEYVSANDFGHALVKVIAYSAYRDRVENELFDHDTQHAELNIADRVRAGFNEYVASEHLVADIEAGEVPHPFDRHPPLYERLQAVGCHSKAEDMRSAITAGAEDNWPSQLPAAADIEAQLWADYEQRFNAVHEQALAYRYLPDPESTSETSLVERHFPSRELVDKRGNFLLRFDHQGLQHRDWKRPLHWRYIKSLGAHERTLGVNLEIVEAEGNSVTVDLNQFTQGHEWVYGRLHSYWERQLVAMAHAEQEVAAGTEH